MRTVQYQRWNPPQSPVRIEFLPQLLTAIALASGEPRGSLYGLSLGGEIRVLGARPETGAPARWGVRAEDPPAGLEAPSGIEKVGIYVRRTGGEVFLAESDLERFEAQRVAIALVIAGTRAGFFVRQADGSIQAIRSHEEFSVVLSEGVVIPPSPAEPHVRPVSTPSPTPAQQATQKPAVPKLSAPDSRVRLAAERARGPKLRGQQAIGKRSRGPRSSGPKRYGWARVAAVLLAIPLAALAYFRPTPSVPAQLKLEQAGNAVSISWNRAAVPQGGHLYITDNSSETAFDVRPDQSSLSYAPRGDRLAVRLTQDGAGGSHQLDAAAINLTLSALSPASGPAPSLSAPAAPPSEAEGPSEADQLRDEIGSLEHDATKLHKAIDGGRARMARLQKSIDRLTHP